MSDASETDAPVHLILGATGGIGSELCRRLSESGARLAIAARSKDKLDGLASEYDALPIELDATDFDQVQSAVDKTVEHYGRIDGAVNCVGSILLKPAHLTSRDDYDTTIALNLTSSFALVRSAAKAMQGNENGGSIVLLTTAAARVGLANHEPIAAAKAAVIGLAQAAASTYAVRNVRVNCVAPGLTRTPLSKPIISNEAAEKASLSMHPLNRLGEPKDIARAIQFLLDPENNWITAQVFGVDGGIACARPRATA